jgi:hypothetical protein
MSSKFRFKSKPIRPVRKKKILKTKNIKDCNALFLLSTLEDMKTRGVDLNKAYVEAECEEEYYGGVNAIALLQYYEDESIEEYAVRLSAYEKKNEDYIKWAEENKEALKEYQQKENIKQSKALEKETAQIEKELDKLEKKLQKLKR